MIKVGDLVACTHDLMYFKHISSLGMYRLDMCDHRKFDDVIVDKGSMYMIYLGHLRRREYGMVLSPCHGMTLIEPDVIDRLYVVTSIK